MQDSLPTLQPKAGQPCPSPDSYVESQTEFDSTKRKPSASGILIPNKKPKLGESTGLCFQSSSNAWQLPAEIWQRIFTFIPPKMLGRLLSVNKCFHSLLNPSPNHAQLPILPRPLSNLKPEVIWQLSRRRFWAAMPTPLQGHTELQMWQLACHNRCQFCGMIGRMNLNATYDLLRDQHKHAGPRPIWPFALRSCGPCLLDRTIKEVDLLLSSSVPSCLMPALPFILIDDNTHIIPSAMLQLGRATPELSITKLFLSSHVTAIHEEFKSVRALGEATAGEWIKGLERRGKEYRAKSLRWEKFEISGGVIQMRQHLPHNPTAADNASNEATKGSIPLIAVDPPRGRETIKSYRRTSTLKKSPLPPLVSDVDKSIDQAKPVLSQVVIQHNKAWEIAERMKAARKDIDPKQHQSNIVSTLSQVTTTELPNSQGVQELTLEAKQRVDRAWDDAQAPLRAQIAALADKFIRDSWGNCRNGLGKKRSARFAVEVLLYVRRKFYASIEYEEVDAVARAAGKEPLRDSPKGPFTRKLTLENMKWVFDVKVKPFTGEFGKDLFYCSNCYKDNFKLYSFEGVIQHYAAKHTGCLSLGSAVVHWRAEWPEVPPFHPKPHTNSHLAIRRKCQYMAIPHHITLIHRTGRRFRNICGQCFAPEEALTLPLKIHTKTTAIYLIKPTRRRNPTPRTAFNLPVQMTQNWRRLHETQEKYGLHMAPLREFPRPIRVFVVIHHVCARFQARFSELLPLHLFIDGLYTKKGMRPVRKVNGLQCKVCCLALGTTLDTDRHEEFYNLGQLAKHFNQRHCQQQHAIGAPVFNWCTDMISLPPHALSDSSSVARIDHEQLGLIQSALPGTYSNIGTLIARDRTFDGRYHASTPNPTRRERKPQEASSHNKVARNAGEGISKKAQSSAKFAKINDLGTRSKSLLSKPTCQSTATMDTDSRSDPMVNTLPIHESPESIDLIAGLESQLDQQSLSPRPDNSAGRDS
ncbi:hypothetical protein RRF57_003887 [Xylaria bambusicola]|uniref:DUF7892 domain-containing protein n=1 Tax=Xylaria bambusicola TaxID=326684 RepID=A0AAN7Z398_9PEZI